MHLMNCPVCGKRIPFNSPYCPECDFDLTEYVHDTSRKKHSLRKRIIGIVSIVMIGLVIIDVGISLWSNSGHKVALPSVDDSVSPNPAVVSVSTAKEYNSKSQNTSLTPIVSETTTPTPVNISDPVGVYNGNDGNVLVLSSNGLAYYYCSDVEFTELELPWEYSNDKLSVQFSKLHCTPTADIEGNNFSYFTLRSDSENWDDEPFTRINVDPNEYIKRKVLSYTSLVNVNSDGSLSFTIDDLTFTIPKQYRTPPGSDEIGANAISFVDNDVDTDYISTLLFYQDNAPTEAEFPSRFLEDYDIASKSTTKVSNRDAVTYSITGVFNLGFPSLSGIQQKGKYTVITNPDGKTVLYVLMLQTENRTHDNTEYFEEIIRTAH